jgi:hypothetical protein
LNAAANSNPSRTSRILAGFRLIYTELQYWLVGLTPEGYHHAQASAWEDLGNFDRAARHLRAYLQNSDKPQMRALLAYCYSRLERWPDAAREYTTAITKWPHPSLLLGLAEAKLHLGEIAYAAELAASVERSATPLEPYVARALEFLKPQLQAASNTSLSGCLKDKVPSSYAGARAAQLNR